MTEETLNNFSFFGITKDSKLVVDSEADLEHYEMTVKTRNIVRRANMPKGVTNLKELSEKSWFDLKVIKELIENGFIQEKATAISVKDIPRTIYLNNNITLNKIECRIEDIKDFRGDRIPDMARFIQYYRNESGIKLISSIHEGDMEEIEEAVRLATDRILKIKF